MLSNMDLTLAQMVHYLLLGNRDPVLKSEAIWVCVYAPERMYGPPHFSKRKVKVAGRSAQMHS